MNKPGDRVEAMEKEMIDVSDDDDDESSISDSESEAESEADSEVVEEKPLVFEEADGKKEMENLDNIISLSASTEPEEEIIELHGGTPPEDKEEEEFSEESLFGFSVAVLKGIAEKKGFEKYKSLRKPQLVELLLTFLNLIRPLL